VHIDVDAKYDGGPTLQADAAAPLEYAYAAGSIERHRAMIGRSSIKSKVDSIQSFETAVTA
jgi:hypothetical protein